MIRSFHASIFAMAFLATAAQAQSWINVDPFGANQPQQPAPTYQYQQGARTYGSDGSSSTRIGSTDYHSNGTSTYNTGNTGVQGNGGYSYSTGNSTRYSDGKICREIANVTYCR